MGEGIPAGWDSIGTPRSKENQILEPNRPAHFLAGLIDKAPNAAYPGEPERENKVKTHHEFLRSCAERIEEIGRELSEAFIETYAKHGLHIKHGLRFYIVGGRLEAKTLFEGSDLDCAFTALDPSEDVHPKYGEESKEMTDKKRDARKEFFFGPFLDISRKHGFITKSVSAEGSAIEVPILEPKEHGSSDEAFRERNLPALLVLTLPAERVAK